MLEAIPKSAGQKIQRWKLVEQLGQPRSDGIEGFQPPADIDVHEEVDQAWEQELGARPAQPNDNFFSSGGSSMMAAGLAGNLSARLHTAVDAAMVFKHPEPIALAAALRLQLQPAHARVGSCFLEC